MSDFDDNRKEKAAHGTQIGGVVAGLFALIGIYFYATGQNYLDETQIYLAPAFLVFVLGIFFSLRANKIFIAIICVFFAGLIIAISNVKINWQKDYQQQMRSSSPFLFYNYVESYPTWEEYTFAKLLKKPDWVRFTNECAEPVLAGKTPGAFCKSYSGIQEQYFIDMRSELASYLKRMRNTAKLVKDGRIEDSKKYQGCINQQRCAPIPLLPDGVNADAIAPSSGEHMNVRRPFWQLINSADLTPEICSYMLLCRVLNATGALEFSK